MTMLRPDLRWPILTLLLLQISLIPQLTNGQSSLPQAPAPSQTKAAPTAVSNTTKAPELSPDYVYEDIPAMGTGGGGAPGGGGATGTKNTGASDGLFYPLYSDYIAAKTAKGAGLPLKPPFLPLAPFPAGAVPAVGGGVWGGEGQLARPPIGVGGVGGVGGPMAYAGGDWGEGFESLRNQLRQMKRYGVAENSQQLDSLQQMYPGVNVTELYDSPALFMGGDGYEMDEAAGYWYNGTYYQRPGGDMEDGYWYNGTYYRSPGGEMEDGYWYNGTYYPGEMEGPEMEDGFFHNGTFYPGEMEGPEMEDGYFYNGTFYPGYEQEEQEGYYGGGGEEREDLMWWQLHHPRWRDAAARENTVAGGNTPLASPPRDGKWGAFMPPYAAASPYGKPPPALQAPPYAYGKPPVLPPGYGRLPYRSPYYAQQLQPPPPAAKKSPTPPRRRPTQQQQQQQGKGGAGSAVQTAAGAAALGAAAGAGVAKTGTAGSNTRPINAPRAPPPRPQTRPRQGGSRFPVPSQRRQYAPRPNPNPNPSRRGPSGSGGGGAPPPRSAMMIGSDPKTGKLNPPQHSLLTSGIGKPPNTGLPTSDKIISGSTQIQTGSAQMPPGSAQIPPGSAQIPPGSAQTLQGTGNADPHSSGFVRKKSSPLDPYRVGQTAAIGIVLASLIGLCVIFAPLVCLLYKYRQEKRIKKRTFLRRPEHGSVDEGIMDAMIMSDFGEKKSSRVKKIGGGKGGGGGKTTRGGTGGGGKMTRGGGGGSGLTLSQARQELRGGGGGGGGRDSYMMPGTSAASLDPEEFREVLIT